MHSVTTHVIYWDPSGEFTATTKEIIHKFFADVAHDSGLASNVFGIAGQYGDGSGHALYSSVFGTEATDATAYPAIGCAIPKEGDSGPPYTHCVTDAQLQSELAAYVAAHSLPRGPTQQYFVLLPHRVVTCLPVEEGIHPCSNNFFCAYHSAVSPGTSNEIIYSDIPFSLLDSEFAKACQADENAEIQHPNGDTAGGDETTKFADIALKYISHEYIEAATDPLGNGWWENAHGQEVADKCNFAGSGTEPGEDPKAFLPTLGGSAVSGTLFNQAINAESFYIQSEWDNTAKACLMKPQALSAAKFTTSSTSGIVGSPVKFSGAVTDPYGGPGFTWKFGDGTESTGATSEHVYAAPGSYEVTMTVKDQFTGSTSPPATHTFQVVGAGPATESVTAPASPPSVAPSTASTASTASNTSPSTNTPVAATPNSNFGVVSATINPKSGAITFTGSVGDPGTFSWLLTFQNGKFGVFASAPGKCKKGFVRLKGRCRPARIVFAKGSKFVAAPGTVSFTVRPSTSALKALKNALKRRKGVPVTATFTFQSSRGGSPFSRTQALSASLRKKSGSLTLS